MVTLRESQAYMLCMRTWIQQCSWLYQACVVLSVNIKHLSDTGALSSRGCFFLMPPRGQMYPLFWSGIKFRGDHTLVTQLLVAEAGCKLRPLNKSSVGRGLLAI